MYAGYTHETKFQEACREAGKDPQLTAEHIQVLREQCECNPVDPVCWACQKRYKIETELGLGEEIPY